MSDLQVPNGSILAAVGAAITASVAWVMRVERKFGTALTRKEHSDICEQRQEAMKEDLARIDKRFDELTEMIREDQGYAREHRERMANAVHAIGLQVAVLRTQAGNPPSGDTGRFAP